MRARWHNVMSRAAQYLVAKKPVGVNWAFAGSAFSFEMREQRLLINMIAFCVFFPLRLARFFWSIRSVEARMEETTCDLALRLCNCPGPGDSDIDIDRVKAQGGSLWPNTVHMVVHTRNWCLSAIFSPATEKEMFLHFSGATTHN
jgi:hypothetical protein